MIAFNTVEGWSRDVSEDCAGELLERASDGDDILIEVTRRFITRHRRRQLSWPVSDNYLGR